MKPTDFGYKNKMVPFEQANVVLLFELNHPLREMGGRCGPGAVHDASRYIELFEMQVGASPLDVGACSDVTEPEDPLTALTERTLQAVKQKKIPIVINTNRRFVTSLECKSAVALWGKLGRNESDESTFVKQTPIVLAGIRAASSNAFQTVPETAVILPAEGLKKNPSLLLDALKDTTIPVHLSIDLDVLSPGSAQTPRSIEPGGFDWYELVTLLDMIATGPGIQSVDITGTGDIAPRSAAATLVAQLTLRVMGICALSKET